MCLQPHTFFLAVGIVLGSLQLVLLFRLRPFSKLTWDVSRLERCCNPAFLVLHCGPAPFWTCRRPPMCDHGDCCRSIPAL